MSIFIGNSETKKIFVGGSEVASVWSGNTKVRPSIVDWATQGPAPSGFHVPLIDEWTTLYNILTSTFGLSKSAGTIGSYLKMPRAGYRDHESGNRGDVGSYGYYWASSYYNGYGYAYCFEFRSSSITPQSYYRRAQGHSVRCFKNYPDIPDATWTTLYDGSGIASGAGVFRNSTLGLISISGDGITWYTIQDKNLGATTVYNRGGSIDDSTCGYFYQWGNNYGFAHSGTISTSTTQVNASSYGPGNYYSSNIFIRGYSDWSNVTNNNLWGGVDGNVPVN